MKRFAPWLKLAFSLAMLAVVLTLSNPEQLLPVLRRANPVWLLAGVGLWIAIQLLNVYKWWLLSRAQRIFIGYRQLLDVYYIGMFFNTFLPSGFGGDAIRAYEMSRLTRKGGASTASVLIDRFTSLYALLLMATVALLLAPPTLRIIPLPWLLLGDVLGALFFLGMMRGGWGQVLARVGFFAKRDGLRRFLTELDDSAAALRGARGTVALSLAISLLFQLLSAVEHQFFLWALGLDVPMSYTALFFPILAIVSSLPVTINGLGLREGGFVFFLALAGVPKPEAALIGLLSLSMLLLSGAWGAVVYMGIRQKVPSHDELPASVPDPAT